MTSKTRKNFGSIPIFQVTKVQNECLKIEWFAIYSLFGMIIRCDYSRDNNHLLEFVVDVVFGIVASFRPNGN